MYIHIYIYIYIYVYVSMYIERESGWRRVAGEYLGTNILFKMLEHLEKIMPNYSLQNVGKL